MAFNTLFLTLAALGFVAAAFFSYREKWNFGFSFSLVAVAFFAALALPSTQSFLRTAVWGAFVTSVEKLQVGLTSVNDTIEEIRVQMQAEQAAREQQQTQLDEAQERILLAQSELEEQAKRLVDTNALVKAFYEKAVKERFKQNADSKRLMVLGHGPGKTSVYILLQHTPIPQTVDINWDVYDQLSDAWELEGNVIRVSSESLTH